MISTTPFLEPMTRLSEKIKAGDSRHSLNYQRRANLNINHEIRCLQKLLPQIICEIPIVIIKQQNSVTISNPDPKIVKIRGFLTDILVAV